MPAVEFVRRRKTQESAKHAIGEGAIDERGTVYHESLEIARLVGKMAASATRLYVAADSSKIGRTA